MLDWGCFSHHSTSCACQGTQLPHTSCFWASAPRHYRGVRDKGNWGASLVFRVPFSLSISPLLSQSPSLGSF